MSITRNAHQGIADYTLISVFGSADCQHLAAALADQYDLDMVFVGAEDGSWHHALVYHAESGLFLDITGVKTLDEVQADWEDWDGWDAIYPASEVNWDLNDRTRPDVPVSAGVEMVLDHATRIGLTINPR